MKHWTFLSAAALVCLSSTAWAQDFAGGDASRPREGDTLVVTATRSEQAVSEAPATISVVTGTELRRRPVQDLAEALENEPGVVINGIGMTRRGISIRGMSNEHVLTLIDGRRINDSAANMAHVDFDLGWVPSIAIDQIELVRGPLSALYGSEALAGVVNVRTRRPERLEVSALGILGFRDGEGGDSAQLSALVGGPLSDTLGLVAWGEYRHRDRTQSAADPRQSELEEREALSGSIIGWWTPAPGHRIEIGQAAIDDDRTRDTITTGSAPVYYEYRDHVTRAQTHGSYTGEWGWGSVQARAYRSVLERVNERDQNQTPTQPTRGVDFVADAQLTVAPFSGARLTLGGEHRNEWLRDATINTAGEASVNHDALFVQAERELTRGATLTAGSRFDHHDAYGWETSPRAYLVIEPLPGLTLRGGVGGAFKAPSLKQLSPGYITVAAGGRFIITGNPDLKPETSTSYEAGATYYGSAWQLGATVFQNDLNNLVQTECVAFCGIRGRERRTYLNVNRARIRGVEVSGSVSPVATITLSGSYSYVDPRDLSADQELTERPNHTAKVQLGWQALETTRLEVRGRYIGEQTLLSNAVPVRLPDYSLWSLDASQALTDALTLKAGVDNLFDERLSDASGLYSFAEPGRIFFVGLGANF